MHSPTAPTGITTGLRTTPFSSHDKLKLNLNITSANSDEGQKPATTQKKTVSCVKPEGLCQSRRPLLQSLRRPVQTAARHASYALAIAILRTWRTCVTSSSGRPKEGRPLRSLAASTALRALAASLASLPWPTVGALSTPPVHDEVADDATLFAFMASRKKTPSDRPTDRLPVSLDEPFEDEWPIDFPGSILGPVTLPPTDLQVATIPSPPPSSPSTSPELGYYTCPTCHAEGDRGCPTCLGDGMIDRDAMKKFKEKKTP